MERLSVPDQLNPGGGKTIKIIDARKVKDHSMEIYWRLKAIEDILGTTYDLSRLKELVEADREGRCVMLPAPFGTKMYIIANTRSRYGKKGKCVRPSKMTWYNAQDYTKNFGKTVFITREAAEKALEVAGCDKNGITE